MSPRVSIRGDTCKFVFIMIPFQADKTTVDLRSGSMKSFFATLEKKSIPFPHNGRIITCTHESSQIRNTAISAPPDSPGSITVALHPPWGLITILDVDLRVSPGKCHSADILGHGGTASGSSPISVFE